MSRAVYVQTKRTYGNSYLVYTLVAAIRAESDVQFRTSMPTLVNWMDFHGNFSSTRIKPPIS